MSAITVDTSQIERLTADLASAGVKVAAAATVVVTVEAETVRRGASARSPVDTGALRAGWYVEDGGMGDKIVTNDTREAFYQEFGTSVMAPQPSLFPASAGSDDRLGKALLAKADPW